MKLLSLLPDSNDLVLVFGDELTNVYQRVLKDLIKSFELLGDSFTQSKSRTEIRTNVFEWPLVEGDGDPAKALSVFDKYSEEGRNW